MRPIRSFLLLLIFLICFTGLSFIIPGSIKLPVIHDFIPVDFPVKSVIQAADTNLVKEKKDTIPVPVPDTLLAHTADSVKNNADFPKYISEVFDSLKSSDRQIRIMYYGDSQIEGDRITSHLRKILSKKYGGTGPGLILPLMPVMYSKSVYIRSSANWKRYNYLSYKNGVIGYRSFGPFMTICRFLPPGKTAAETEKAFVRIIPSQPADSAAAIFEMLRLFYGNVTGTVNISVKADGKEVLKDTLSRATGVNELICNLTEAKDIRIEFEGKVSPDIYGISIEDSAGIVVDNIPQRGSAGLEFTMVEKENLRESYALLKPDLFILQYGLNIVKNVRTDYSYYENGLYRQLMLLKEICPETPVLVVSLTDMAFSEGDSIKSYPNIEIIRDAQERAAERGGAAFWDSYSAMGGKKAIVKWSQKSPALAQTDYVHFTYPGADSLSGLLVGNIFSYEAKTDSITKTDSSFADTVKQVIITPVVSKVVQPEQKSVFNILISKLLSYKPDNPFIFTTPGFWLFFLIVLAGYSIFYRNMPMRNIYLFLISLFFYFKTGGLFLFLLIFVTLVDYTCGLLIFNSKGRFGKKFFIILSVVSNLGLLAYFKYAAFIIESINGFFGTGIKVFDILSSLSNTTLGTSFDTSFIILPVGISFFTFQSLSYTIDIYRNKMKPVKNIIDFGFYVSFFPHLVAGPIVRASVFIPQIYQKFSLNQREFSHALFMISKGLIKKIIISNFIAVNLIDKVFGEPALYSGFENLMAVYGYGLQIYCDFSGYTDIAIGVALILGFRLPLNFNSPYKASNITDFWKRWHISLSQWLKDYLYISLGGNRKGKFRTYLNLMITMLLGGLWHGASLRFIIWGALHGAGLVIHKAWTSLTSHRFKPNRFGRIAGIIITFHFVSFCWIFFRAESMEDVGVMLKQIFQNFSPGAYLTLIPAYANIFLIMLTGYIIHFISEKTKEFYRGVFIKIPLVMQLGVVMVIAILLFQMRTVDVMPFIYFRF